MSEGVKPKFLNEIVTILQEDLDSDETIKAVFNLIRKTIPFNAATLFLYDEEEDTLEVFHQEGEYVVDLANQVELERGKGLSSWMTRKKEPIVLPSLSQSRPGKDKKINSFVSMPLWVGDKLIGVLNLSHKKEDFYDNEEIEKYETIATQVSNIVERIELRRELVKKNRILQNTVKKLKETRAELVEKEKLAAVGEVAVTVNHKINNPLTNIIGLAEVLRVAYNAGKEDKVREGLKGILEQAKRIEKVTKKLTEIEEMKSIDYVDGKKMLDLDDE